MQTNYVSGNECQMSRPHRSETFLKTGHAPSHLRECLLEALDHGEDWFKNLEMDFMREHHQRWWNSASPSERAYWLLGQLWDCADFVPLAVYDDVKDWLDPAEEQFARRDLGTYARLARALKRDLDGVLASGPG